MAKVERFEDLKCWQEARVLTNEIYELVEQEALAKDFRLRDQLTGAAVSVMTNIAEGFARYHKGDFVRFLDYAQSSAAEVKSLLYVVLDQHYADADIVTGLQKQSETCQKMILGLLKHVRRTMQHTSNSAREPRMVYNDRSTEVLDAWTLPESTIASTDPSTNSDLQS